MLAMSVGPNEKSAGYGWIYSFVPAKVNEFSVQIWTWTDLMDLGKFQAVEANRNLVVTCWGVCPVFLLKRYIYISALLKYYVAFPIVVYWGLLFMYHKLLFVPFILCILLVATLFLIIYHYSLFICSSLHYMLFKHVEYDPYYSSFYYIIHTLCSGIYTSCYLIGLVVWWFIWKLICGGKVFKWHRPPISGNTSTRFICVLSNHFELHFSLLNRDWSYLLGLK